MPDWRPTARQGLWAFRIVLAIVVVLGLLTLVGQPFGITLWDWLKLLVVPAVLAGGGIWFNRQQQERQLQASREQQQREFEIADRRTQDDALQAYLDQMSQMLLDKDRPLYRARPGENLSMVARARTLTMLSRLDGDRKGSVLRFLYESKLISNVRLLGTEDAGKRALLLGHIDLLHKLDKATRGFVRGGSTSIIELRNADLSEAVLSGAELPAVDLSGVDLSSANLEIAFLVGASFERARLPRANLQRAFLQMANLSYALLIGANLLETNLSYANLSYADLRGVYKAALLPSEGTKKLVTNEELEQQASSLTGATMPNGQKYEDWIKDKEGHKEAGANG